MKHKCNRCDKTTNLIFKLGGLICRNCRTILFWPDSDEYIKILKNKLKETKKETKKENNGIRR